MNAYHWDEERFLLHYQGFVVGVTVSGTHFLWVHGGYELLRSPDITRRTIALVTAILDDLPANNTRPAQPYHYWHGKGNNPQLIATVGYGSDKRLERAYELERAGWCTVRFVESHDEKGTARLRGKHWSTYEMIPSEKMRRRVLDIACWETTWWTSLSDEERAEWES